MPPDPVDWQLAQRVAIRAAGREPFADSYLGHSLHADFAAATAEAEALVAEHTGLRSQAGPARARVTDRAGWIRANIASFRRLLGPLSAKLGERLDGRPTAGLARRVAGVEVGLLLGWMSGRVLGQYDLLVVDDVERDEQDVVYYVGPNVLALEKRHAFPPQEFRLWLALHEVTHRAQFTGIPWLREHYLALVHRALDSVDPDPRRVLDALGRIVADVREGRRPLDDGGLVTLFASADQRAALDQIAGMMSLLEGHGDVTMDRAGAGRVPSADRFARVLRERRARVSAPVRTLQRLTGIDAKLRQYAMGERFIAHVERHGGPDALAAAWRGSEWLPTIAEIRDPDEWLGRVRLSEELAADV